MCAATYRRRSRRTRRARRKGLVVQLPPRVIATCSRLAADARAKLELRGAGPDLSAGPAPHRNRVLRPGPERDVRLRQLHWGRSGLVCRWVLATGTHGLAQAEVRLLCLPLSRLSPLRPLPRPCMRRTHRRTRGRGVPPATSVEGGPDASASPNGPGPLACGSYPLPVPRPVRLALARAAHPPAAGRPPAGLAPGNACRCQSFLIARARSSAHGTVTSDAHSGTTAAFEFNADGTFVGGPRGAMLPIAVYLRRIVDGDRLHAHDRIDVRLPVQHGHDHRSGLVSSSECDAVTLQDVGDDCAGGRKLLRREHSDEAVRGAIPASR